MLLQVKLVVVDSVAFHLRRDFDNGAGRTRLLNGMAQTLLRLASTHKLAVRPLCVFIFREGILATLSYSGVLEPIRLRTCVCVCVCVSLASMHSVAYPRPHGSSLHCLWQAH